MELFSNLVESNLQGLRMLQETFASSSQTHYNPSFARQEPNNFSNHSCHGVHTLHSLLRGLLSFFLLSLLGAGLGNADTHWHKSAASRSWQKLLFIPDGKITPFQTVIDDPSFFFHKGSASTVDPLGELQAALKAFQTPVDLQYPDRHPQCLFPARFQWIREQFGSSFIRSWPKPQCQELANFLKIAAYEEVQLVFTNEYINNPASMFGHTFLKLKRRRDPASATYHPLLDDAVNFAAAVDPNDGLIYPIKGLAGGYSGFFSLIPYHRKTQEYNNYESRDLWEYPLDLTPTEIHRLTLILWELGGKKTSYYYFTQNCSFILLSLLEAAAPRHKLTKGFLLFAIPADTVRAAIREAGTEKSPQYRPSSLSRYQRELLKSLVLSDEDFTKASFMGSGSWDTCDDLCRLMVFDTALEFFEFDERLSGESFATTYGNARQAVLLARASIQKPSPLLDNSPKSSPPHKGHPSSLIEFRVGATASSNSSGPRSFSTLRWRPAVQDFSDPSSGYNKGMELKFLDTTLRWQPPNPNQALWIQDLTFLSATSLPAQVPLVTPWGWNYALGMERGYGKGGKDARATTTQRTYLQGGPGLAQAFFKEALMIYGFINIDFGFAQGEFHGGSHLMGGLIYEPDFGIKLHSRWQVGKLLPNNVQRVRSLNMLALGLGKRFSGVLNLDYWTDRWESSLGIRSYF
jgi:hypothetical protein